MATGLENYNLVRFLVHQWPSCIFPFHVKLLFLCKVVVDRGSEFFEELVVFDRFLLGRILQMLAEGREIIPIPRIESLSLQFDEAVLQLLGQCRIHEFQTFYVSEFSFVSSRSCHQSLSQNFFFLVCRLSNL